MKYWSESPEQPMSETITTFAGSRSSLIIASLSRSRIGPCPHPGQNGYGSSVRNVEIGVIVMALIARPP